MSHTDDTRGRAAPRRRGPALTRRAFVGLAGAAGLGLAAGAAAGSRAPPAPPPAPSRSAYVSPRTGPDAAFTSSDPFVLSKVRAALARA